MTLGSLFDGIAGFPYAAGFCGIKALWASEIEPACISITKRHFPDMKHLGDITKINGAEIAPVDIITFGSPCQDMSIAGNRAGLNKQCTNEECRQAGISPELDCCPVCGEPAKETRSGLFREAIRIINEMREATNGKHPTWAVWENVPGAFSSNDGLDFKAMLQSFTNASIPMPPHGVWADSGMVRRRGVDIAWRVLDARYWGVPQRRRRIFLVADFGGQRAAEVLFKPESLHWNSQTCRQARKSTAGSAGEDIEASRVDYLTGWDTQERRVFSGKGITPALTGCDGKGGRTCAGYLFENHGQDSRITGPHDICPTVTEKRRTGGNNTPLVAGFNGWRSISGSLEYEEDRAPCLQANMPPYAVHQNQCGETRLGEVANTLNTNGNASGRNSPLAITYALDCRNHNAQSVSGMLQAKPGGGHSLNYINPIAVPFNNVWPDIAYTLKARHGSSPRPKELNGICCVAPTLDASYNAKFGSDQFIKQWEEFMQQYAVRRLTPMECERLQGFPDEWTANGHDGKKISDSARCRALGNSVAIPCVVYVLCGIAEMEQIT